MKNLNILIVDDEVLIAEDLKDLLLEFGCVKIQMTHSKIDALKLIEAEKPDVILLDIRMEEELDGLKIGAHINLNYDIPFIYITAHSDMAMISEILKTKPAGYITKPIKKMDLYAALSLVEQKYVITKPKELHLKDGYSTLIIPFEEILYIESDGNYVTVFTTVKKTLSRQSMDSIMEQLNDDLFIRTHRSFIVNISKVTRYSKKELEINEIKIPISRSNVDEFEKKFNI